MTYAALMEPGTAPIVGAIITSLFTVNVIFFKWLLGSFASLRTDINVSNGKTQDWLDEHENKDQSRHEENLYRFEKIAVALAKLGADNGTHR